jgi:catechol 2,3-dioxygenase-like lactoylglutathione lyase family enzyme
MQRTQLRYVIKFVADMDKAVKFHRDVLGLKVKFESPGLERVRDGRHYPRAASVFREEPTGT